MGEEGTGPPGSGGVIDFVSSITDPARLRIEESLPHGFVRLKVAEAERRQARHDIRSVEDVVKEMARNSRDAGSSHVLVATQKERGRFRRITVVDDGHGIPREMHRVVFEPRVTSRCEDFSEDRYGVHGRGMALFSICSQTEEAGVVSSESGKGSAITVTVDLERLPEKSDQATMPSIVRTEDQLAAGAGPHNVARLLVELSIDFPGVDFYLGSFSEALATSLFLSGTGEGVSAKQPWGRLKGITEAKELAGTAGSLLGIPVSERNAYRVLKGEISPLRPILESALQSSGGEGGGETAPAAGNSLHRSRRNRLVRVSAEDMERIGKEAQEKAERILSRYFLAATGKPKVRRGRGRLTITIHVSGEEER